MRVVQMSASSAPANLQSDHREKDAGIQKWQPQKKTNHMNFKFDFKNFKSDDWLLLSIIATLILEGSDDYILLCALGYLFIMGLV